ncbi:hypothetical protein OCU04_002701 [Sclerotinia nivalis]|uniref:ABC transporter domain-containing protein n=1 Tax=Sclerotinia nivalis TaxID=352851 RepID=A0A9X0AU69_9HELO|nr:hypothetical protein OCU04_002701 [Sclerotinia nivalis]
MWITREPELEVKSFEANTLSENVPPEVNLPPSEWPIKGKVEFRDVTVTYGSIDELAVCNVPFSIEGGTKTGIVGRTGSGKSSLMLALFRMLELKTGDILIDNVSISTLDRQSVRCSFITIPQEPYFLSGTLLRQQSHPDCALSCWTLGLA